MQIQVNVNTLNAITRDHLNENEYNVHKVIFDFAEEYSDSLVKVALFTQDGTTYKMMVENNQCDIPPEILSKKGTFILGLYAYEVQDEELILRYSPSPIKLFISAGSYIKDEDTENSEPITPTEMEQYEQILHDSVTEMNIKLAEIDEAIEEANNLDIDVTKEGDTATITVTKKDGTTKSETVKDGKDGKDGADGKDGKDGKDGQDGYTPQKGTDYWTQQDKEEIIEDVEEELVIPTKTSDLTNDSGFIDNTVNNLVNYELKTNTGSSIALSINPSTYVMTLQLKNSSGTVLSEGTVDLPLETMVVNARYDSTNKLIILTLQNGTEVSFSVADLVSGLVDETTFNTAIQGLQNNINAKYTKPNTGIPKTDLSNEVQTSLGKADTAIQESDLADYVKNTDYATNQKGGVIKTRTDFGTNMTNGFLGAETKNINDYNNASNVMIIGKGTLENVITGKNLETANNKTTTLDENSTDTQYPSAKTVYDNYKDIIKTNEEQAEEIEDLKKNRLTNTPEIATEIDLNDSADSKVVSMNLKGNSEQESTEGYNLLKPTLTVNGENINQNSGSVTLSDDIFNFTATGNDMFLGQAVSAGSTYIGRNGYLMEIPSTGTIYIKCSNSNFNKNLVSFFDENKVSLGFSSVTSNGVLIPSNAKYCCVRIGIAEPTIGQTYSTTIMVSTVNTDYEKYTNGASPNPEYEQPIYSCGENVNLFDKDSAFIGYELDGNNGQIHENSMWYSSDYIPVEELQTYYLSGEKTGGQSNCFYDENKIFLSTQRLVITGAIETPENAKYMRINGFISELDNHIKIEKGSTATPYSPYGMGSLSEKIVNKNLFDMSVLKTSTKGTVNNQEFTITDNSTDVYLLGNYSTSSSKIFTIKKGMYKFTSNNSEVRVSLYYVDGNSLASLDTTFDYTTLSKDTDIVAIRARGSLSLLNKTFSLQLEQGSTSTSYEPHQEQNYIIPTQQSMRAIGEVRDDFVKVDGNWYERHYIVKVVLDGINNTFEAKTSATTNNVFRTYAFNQIAPAESGLVVKNAYSNYFIATTQNYLSANDSEGFAIRPDKIINFGFGLSSSINTLELANQFLQNNNVEVICELAEPTLLPCTEEQITALENLQKARTYKNVTHIYSEDEVKPYIDMEYVQDLRTVINNLS